MFTIHLPLSFSNYDPFHNETFNRRGFISGLGYVKIDWTVCRRTASCLFREPYHFELDLIRERMGHRWIGPALCVCHHPSDRDTATHNYPVHMIVSFCFGIWKIAMFAHFFSCNYHNAIFLGIFCDFFLKIINKSEYSWKARYFLMFLGQNQILFQEAHRPKRIRCININRYNRSKTDKQHNKKYIISTLILGHSSSCLYNSINPIRCA